MDVIIPLSLNNSVIPKCVYLDFANSGTYTYGI